jgi:hypothetical protein
MKTKSNQQPVHRPLTILIENVCIILIEKLRTLAGKISLGFIYPEAEFTREEVWTFVRDYDRALEDLLNLHT